MLSLFHLTKCVKLCCYRAIYTHWISKCCVDRDPERFVARPGTMECRQLVYWWFLSQCTFVGAVCSTAVLILLLRYDADASTAVMLDLRKRRGTGKPLLQFEWKFMQMSCWSHVVFWVVMMLCSHTDGCQVKMEAAYSPGMLVNTYKATQCYNPEGQEICHFQINFSSCICFIIATVVTTTECKRP